MLRTFSLTIAVVFLCSGAQAAQKSRTVKSKNGKAWISQSSRGPGGYKRLLIFKNGKSEIQVDQNGDGYADHVEYSDGKRTVHFSMPLRGQFLSLEVSRREKVGTRRLEYALAPGGQKYRQISSRLEAYQNVFYNEDLKLAPCDKPSDATLKAVSDWQEILKRLGGDPAKELASQLLDPNDPMIDRSCKSGVFKGASKDIAKALAEIMLSPQKTGEAGFLKCLQDNDLGIHAARIERAFYESSHPGAPPLLKCVHWADKNQHGSFKAASNEMFLHQPNYEKHQIRGGDPANMYSEALFHELLHRSEIMDEKMAGNIQRCCGRGAQGDAASCAAMRETISQEKLSRAYNNLFTSKFPEYADLRNRIMQETRSSARGEDFLDDYFGQLDKTLSKAEKAKTACGSGADCDAAFMKTLEDLNDRFFKRRCGSYFEKRGGATKKTCDEYKEKFSRFFKSPAEAGRLHADVRDSSYEQGSSLMWGTLDPVAAEAAEQVTDRPADLNPAPTPVEEVFGPPPPQEAFESGFTETATPLMPPPEPMINQYYDDLWAANPSQTQAAETMSSWEPPPTASPVPVPEMDAPAFSAPPSAPTVGYSAPIESPSYSTPEYSPEYSREYSMRDYPRFSESRERVQDRSEVEPLAAPAPASVSKPVPAPKPAPVPERNVAIDLDKTQDTKATLKLYESRQSALGYVAASAFSAAVPSAGAQTPPARPAQDLLNPFRAPASGKPTAQSARAQQKDPSPEADSSGLPKDEPEEKSQRPQRANAGPAGGSFPAGAQGSSWKSQRQFLSFLSGKYESVRSMIGSREFVSALRTYRVRVTDDKGRTYGPTDAPVHLQYSPVTRRLEVVDGR